MSKDWEDWSWKDERWRLRLVRAFLILLWVVVFVRTAQVQLLEGKRYVRVAEERYTSVIKVEAERGLIRDRNGQALVLNRTSFSLAADPALIESPTAVARRLARLIGGSAVAYERKLRRKHTHFVWLAHDLTRRDAERVRALEIRGLRLVRGSKRAYPHGSLASQVLGFVGSDFRGLSGLELLYDRQLRGRPGIAYLQRDARNGRYYEVSHPSEEAVPGNDLVLTLDYTVQEIVEEELQATLERFRADGGTVIVLRPSTGEVLALASLPSFDPARAQKYPPERWKIRAITDTYEPGSTFKLVTMATVLSQGLHLPSDPIRCYQGRFVYRGKVIRDTKPHGVLTLQQVFEVSSNVGTAQLGIELEPLSLYAMARDFGFGARTGIELPGEVEGSLKHPTQWSGLTPAMMAIGYEVAVTPLQVAMAYAAVANDGILMKPHIVREVRSHDGRVLWRAKPAAVRRVIDRETNGILREFLRGVVERGTGVAARVPGVRVYGKTGTAQKYDPVSGTYRGDEHISSFVGFCETEDDTVLIYTMVDNPKGAYYGSVVAAPLFRKILVRMLRLQKSPQQEAQQASSPRRETMVQQDAETVVVPDVTNRTFEVAERILRDLGLRVAQREEGFLVARQDPGPGEEVPRGTEVTLTLYRPITGTGTTATVPDMMGRTLREAIGLLAARGLTAEIQGSGVVVEQWPEPGKAVQRGFRCRLRCLPRRERVVTFLQ